MLVNFNAILPDAAKGEYIVPGFNIFGYEDARAVIEAAEELSSPVILTTNRDMVRHMEVKYLGPLLTGMARDAAVPVCVHLDHTYDFDTIFKAIKAGYTSVMYDGSQLSLEENIRNTRYIADVAHAFDVTVEGEIGSVPYPDRDDIKSIYTDPGDAERFARESGVDAMAVAVGTFHKLQTQTAEIQYDRLGEIENRTEVPLVIHGTTGIPDDDLGRLSGTRVAKMNIGTALRMAFGHTLREEMAARPEAFDRLELFQRPMREVKRAAVEKMRLLGNGRFNHV